jgi:hypothetical protein
VQSVGRFLRKCRIISINVLGAFFVTCCDNPCLEFKTTKLPRENVKYSCPVINRTYLLDLNEIQKKKICT